MPNYRYCYHNRAYRAAGSIHGELAEPVLRPDGKCVLSKSSQLVTFEDGTKAVVIRRALRLCHKCPVHRDDPRLKRF